ncbi:MAG TPA: 4,5-DOPA dioxygenase extradiol [Armatimonadota bacterium]|jgi:4,5-DOPA dioxygenase extradiol
MTEATMPALFLGHGNPMNALARNGYTEGWAALGTTMPRPKAVLCVSAHWYVGETAVTAMPAPRTIHDFGGFPEELFRCSYPAPGDPDLADRVQSLLSPVPVRLDHEWGLDHGTWAVLCHVYPGADIPVVQLSLDATQPAAFHYELATRLAPLRDEGVLLVGSGNLVHNLHTYAWGEAGAEPYDWAVRFEQRARDCLTRGRHAELIEYQSLSLDARLCVPTPDHYLPLLYVLALQREGEQVSFPVEGMDGGSISMLSVRIG